MKVYILIISFANWCILRCKTQTALTSYLPSYTAVGQHSFAPPPESSFGFSGPTAYTLSGFSPPSKYLGTFKTAYKRPKIYTVLSQKYAIPTTEYEVSNLKHFQEEFHHPAPARYEFQYKVHDPHYGSEFGHAEIRQGDVAKGQYMVLLPDGRRQIVDYIADSHGYRPTIRYERNHVSAELSGNTNKIKSDHVVHAELMDQYRPQGRPFPPNGWKPSGSGIRYKLPKDVRNAQETRSENAGSGSEILQFGTPVLIYALSAYILLRLNRD